MHPKLSLLIQMQQWSRPILAEYLIGLFQKKNRWGERRDPWKFHYFFLITIGNSTSFLIPGNSTCYFSDTPGNPEIAHLPKFSLYSPVSLTSKSNYTLLLQLGMTKIKFQYTIPVWHMTLWWWTLQLDITLFRVISIRAQVYYKKNMGFDPQGLRSTWPFQPWK